MDLSSYICFAVHFVNFNDNYNIWIKHVHGKIEK